MRARLASERGSALVAAALVMLAMLMLGLATLAFIDNETRQSGKERGQESAFNYAEGVLNAQTFAVGSAWPASSSVALNDCTFNGSSVTASGGAVSACPDPAVISQSFQNRDTARGGTWTTMVRDNAGTRPCEDTSGSNCSYDWSDATGLSNAHWDQNGDGLMWLRAQGVVNGRKRTVVALVRIQNDPISFPNAAILASSMNIGTGNKQFVDQNGGPLVVRCADPVNDTTCWNEQKPVNVQGSGGIVGNYQDGGHILSSDELDSLRQTALQNHTWYSTCPDDLNGAVVFVEGDGSVCNVNANNTWNAPPAKPGLLVMVNGAFRFNGAMVYNGLVYVWNPGSNSSGFYGLGNATINGAILVDGPMDAQGSWFMKYNSQAFQAITSYGAAGIVPNSFREFNP